MFERFITLLKAIFNSLLGRAEDAQLMLEQTYADLQANVIQVRQAVAQAIATEKQLEQSLQKNRDQADTWYNRAAMAAQQGNDDLAKQALQRRQQYTQAATDLEAQLKQQKIATKGLMERFTELEAEVQKAYTKKQVLIARDKAAVATTKANEILSKTTASGALNVMERMETKVLEREAQAAALAEMGGGDSLEKQFKSTEGKADLDAELAALKGQLAMGQPKLISKPKDQLLLESEERRSDTIDAQEVREVKND
jgi:phage shock protein A